MTNSSFPRRARRDARSSCAPRCSASASTPVVVPSADPHLSEYLPGHWKGREWLSGFTGSVGTFIATADFAGVWTDARYWTQAETELAGSGVALMKIPSGASLLHIDWLAANLAARPDRGGRRPRAGPVHRAPAGRRAGRARHRAAHRHRPARRGLERPSRRCRPSRCSNTRRRTRRHAAPTSWPPRAPRWRRWAPTRHFISTLDDIACLFNLRGADVSFNPVFLAHALVDAASGATLFVGDGKVPADAARAPAAPTASTWRRYDDAAGALAALGSRHARCCSTRAASPPACAPRSPAACSVVEAINPTTFAKSRKTDAEAAHVRATMEQDGAALCEFFAWLEARLADPQRAAADRTRHRHATSRAARARRPGFVSPSFGTIAGFNANGAIMHYRATEQSHAVIEGDGLLLIDSGGQYLGGTTDITRVVPVGADQRRAPARLHAGAQGPDRAVVGAVPARHPFAAARRASRARRSGPPASTTATAPATASATS